jgi:hypothetical protein
MMSASRIVLAACLAATAIAGCGTSSQLTTEELDPETGVTVTRSTVPLVLYRDRSARAAYARDFVYVGAMSVNRMGDYNHYLWLGIWSSLSNQLLEQQRDGFESIVIFADGEPLQLELTGWTLASVGISRPAFNRPTASAIDAYYSVTLDQIRLIAEAHDVRLHTGEASSDSYEPWDNLSQGLSGMREFVRYLNR